jgi:tetratricopeptide (TPR) repeat protein
MSKPTAASRFILPLSETKSVELYQGLLRGISSYQQLGNRLIHLAEQAHAFRQFDRVREYGQILSHIPIKHHQAIGHYFLAVAANSKGNGDQDEAKRLFELAVDTATDTYKVKSIMSLGALSFHRKDFDSALYYYQETVRAGKLSATSLHAIKAISVIKAIEGSHAQAVKDLESILPAIRYTPAHIHCDILNSYAVELGDMGRKDEARNIMRVVLASPFAFAYPEWRETAEQVQRTNRSFVAVNPSQSGNVLRFWPQDLPSEPVTEKAKILSLAERLEQKRQAIKRKAEKAFKIRTKILSDDLPEDVVDTIMRILGITYYD